MTFRMALRKARDSRNGDDSGFSLIETIVAMSIFGIFTSLVMTALISMLNSTQKSTSLHDGTASLENVFQDLDHQVRYANGVGPMKTLGTNKFFVNWQSQATDTSPLTCTQLRLDTTARTLSSRTWQPGAALVAASPWRLLATNVGKDTSQPAPFQVNFGGVLRHEQLKVNLVSPPLGGSAAKSTTSQINATITALNSGQQALDFCPEVAPS